MENSLKIIDYKSSIKGSLDLILDLINDPQLRKIMKELYEEE